MCQTQLEAILNKIKAYRRILLFRHFRPDGDAIGSTKGLQEILRLTYPEKEVYLINDDASDYLAFLGTEDKPVKSELPDEFFAEALGIVLDTGNTSRISSKKYALCKELIKIDHHIELEPYGNYSWVEDERSSACEMVVKFYDIFRNELKINKEAATYLYTGMVTDSGRFRFSCVTGETMRLAGILLDQGIDTDVLFANLYLEEFDRLKFKAHVYDIMKITEHGVAYLYLDRETQEKFHLSLEDASASISYLDSIKGCLYWIAFIETGDETKSIRVRLRSRFSPINSLAEQYRGGGHACACGATVYSMEEAMELVGKADIMLKEYKETHEGWL